MLFNSFSYAIFFPIVVIMYFSLPKKFRKVFLLASSYFFYSCWNAKYALLMLLSTVVTFCAGILMENSPKNKKKFYLAASFCINLSILFLFKYYGFFIDTINLIMGNETSTEALFILPVGISFYTFQALGYTIDVYRKKIPAERNFVTYALFVSFFPQLVAGPIERSTNLLPQIKSGGKLKYENIIEGLCLILYGLFLKLVIADRAAILVNSTFKTMNFKSIIMILGAFLFSIQIYCDFYSYSIIAKGSAKVLGIDLMDNFKEPFLSSSIVEFWRRWHISLSTWFKDYLYIPLGGSRNGKLRHYLNIFVVFLVSGLWHGANYTFLAWGFIHAILNILEHLLSKFTVSIRNNFFYKNIRRLMTFVFVVIAFVFFRASSISDAINYILAFNNKNVAPFSEEILKTGLNTKNLTALFISILILLLVDILKYNGIDVKKRFMEKNIFVKSAYFMIFLIAVIIFGIYGVGFDESMFIYFQF